MFSVNVPVASHVSCFPHVDTVSVMTAENGKRIYLSSIFATFAEILTKLL